MAGGPGWQLSIDFGTTSTAAAVAVEGEPAVLLQLEPDSNRMPSAVFMERGGTLTAGLRAVNWALTDPSRFLPAPKREVGRKFVTLGDQRLPVAEVLAAVLARMLDEALRQRGGQPPEVIVLTHPARCGPARTAVLTDALRLAAAGLPERLAVAGMRADVAARAATLPAPRLLAEPVAAAWHYAQRDALPAGAALAVYDLGGGTFDTAVVSRGSDGGFDVLADGGLADLGGEDFDAALFALAGSRLEALMPERWQAILDPGDDRAALADSRHLLEHVQAAKEDLSVRMVTDCRLLDDPPEETIFRRKEDLEQLIEPDLLRSADELAATIERAGLTLGGLSGTYLVGGSSRIPLVFALLQPHLAITPTSLGDPKAVVALGGLAAAANPDVDLDMDQEPDPIGDASAGGPIRLAAKPDRETTRPRPEPSRARGRAMTAELEREIRFPRQAGSVVVSQDLGRIIVCYEMKTTIISLPGGQQRSFLETLGIVPFPVDAAALTADGRLLATAANGTVRVRDAATGKRLQRFLLHHHNSNSGVKVHGIKFSHDGHVMATNDVHSVAVWDVATGHELARLRGWHGVSFSHDDRSPAAVWGRRTDNNEVTQVWHIPGVESQVKTPGTALVFSHDDACIALADREEQVQVYSFGEKTLNSLAIPAGSGVPATFSHDDRLLVTDRIGGDAHLWVVASGALVCSPHRGRGHAAQFSADDRLFACPSAQDARVWDTETGAELLSVSHPSLRSMVLSPEGDRLMTAGSEGVRLWRLRVRQ